MNRDRVCADLEIRQHKKRIAELEDQLRARKIDVNSAALSDATRRIVELERERDETNEAAATAVRDYEEMESDIRALQADLERVREIGATWQIRFCEMERKIEEARTAWREFVASSYEHKGSAWHALNNALENEKY